MVYYAHTKGPDQSEWQLLRDHLNNTANLASELGRDAGISEIAKVAGLFHDIGKYSPAFQRRLEGSTHRVDHSTPGAKELLRLLDGMPNKPLADLLAYCIAGHHTGLPDRGSVIDVKGDSTLQARLNTCPEDYRAYESEIDPTQLVLPNRIPIKPIRDFHGKPLFGFSLAFLTRMIYSALVDADFQDTETFVSGEKHRGEYETIESLSQKFNQFLHKFDTPKSEIDQKRNQTLTACIEKAIEKPGFFTLTIPTGGGKTLASMAFALNHAAKYGMKRIIYVIPFTSIIEQNAVVFKDCLGENNVLEHHSNFDWEQLRKVNEPQADDQTNSAYSKLKLAAENWDIPIVVTTNVQFFESLFANRSSRCRKLHNIAKSVVIFDEAQMLPREYLIPAMYAVWELVSNYGASAVFCTATQPSLQQFLPDGTPLTELAPNPQKLFDFYQRVKITNLGKLPDEDLLTQMNAKPQVLCIVNTRRHAKGLFNGLIEDGRFHLSTLMCPAHRKEILGQIRQRLNEGSTCRVISTQVMEAGIDIDFPVGYRSLAGLDSIIQAAGRVNRERHSLIGEVFVFEPVSTYVKRTPAFIEQGSAVTREILHRFAADPISTTAIEAYFAELYTLHDRHAFDINDILAFFDRGDQFKFKTAAENFHIIDSQTVTVIIPYNKEAKELIEELKYAIYPVSVLRKLQPFTISIYEPEYQALNNNGAIKIIGDRYSVLSDVAYYHCQTGLLIPENGGGEAICF